MSNIRAQNQKKTTSPFGSYAFGEFASNEAELTRLEQQATVAWPLERKKLLEGGLQPGMRVLDLASSPGFIRRHIASELGPKGEVVGVDLNDKLLAVANHVAAAWNETDDTSHAGLSFQKGNAYQLDFADDSFDFVYARFLFQHLEQPLDAIAEIRRVLKPGGRFAIADIDDSVFSILPEPPGLIDMLALASAAQAKRGGDRQIGRKLTYYLKKAGFEDIATDLEFISSNDIGLEQFLAITTKFKIELLDEEHRAAAKQVLDSKALTDPSEMTHAIAGVYAVSGSVPKK